MKRSLPTRRKRYLLDQKIQGGLGIRLAMHWGLFFALTLLLNFALRLVSNVDGASWLELVQTVAREQAAATFIILALLPWFINDSIKLTHRFVGPILRIRGAIKQLVGHDDVQPIVLRKGDFFVDVANDFNTLRTQVLHDRQALAQARQQLELVALRSQTDGCAASANDNNAVSERPAMNTTGLVGFTDPSGFASPLPTTTLS